MSKGLIGTLAGVVAIAVIAAGCGSSSSDTSTAEMTKAEFISQADAICRKGNAEIQTEFEALAAKNGLKKNEEPDKAMLVELSETVLTPNVKNQSEELAELGVPSSDEGEISAMLDALDEGIEEAEEDPEALIDGDPFGPANKLAKEYGLKACGQG